MTIKNQNLVLIGQKVALVPYEKEHVPTYHEWMKSPFLQEMTASEPLTLEEEYAMQRSWREDEKKCTFILLASQDKSLQDMTVEELKGQGEMIGDVNIFLNDPDDDLTFGEIEIMIAEDKYRRSGRGLEALKIMMAYALNELGLLTFHAKISLSNEPSIELFKKKLQFYPVSTSQVFNETTLEWSLRNPASTSEEDEDAYGAKATKEQKENIAEMHKQLNDMWEEIVRKDRYE